MELNSITTKVSNQVLYDSEVIYGVDLVYPSGHIKTLDNGHFERTIAVREALNTIHEIKESHPEYEVIVLGDNESDDDGSCIFVIDEHGKLIVKARIFEDSTQYMVEH